MAIPPTKAWTKLIGGPGVNQAHSVSTASDGTIYIAGDSSMGSFDGQSSLGSQDSFLTKFNSDGSKVWTKLIGWSEFDGAKSVSTANDGSIYAAGWRYDNNRGGSGHNAYLSKYNSDGSKVWTKLFEGALTEIANSVASAADGSVYVGGVTESNLDGQINSGYTDVFLAKFNSDGTKLWTRLIGSSSSDVLNSISTASDGSVYVAGSTGGSIFDGQATSGNSDAFLTKYNSDGSKLWTKLLGNSGGTLGASVSAASDGSIYIAGETKSNLDGQTNSGGKSSSADAFLTKFNSDGSKLWTKLLGGYKNDRAASVITAIDGSIYIAGSTASAWVGQKISQVYDVFLAKFNSDGSQAWFKIIPGDLGAFGQSASIYRDGSIYIAGQAYGNFDDQISIDKSDAFITKINGDEFTGNTSSVFNYYNPELAQPLSSWNIYRVNNSVIVNDIVYQWFGTTSTISQMIQDVTDIKLMEVASATWTNNVQINRVARGSFAGGKIEAKQINLDSGEVAGSVISGGNGPDDIKGYAGWDILAGNEGNDLIHGGNGRDIISGGSGRDELHGDFGWNTYRSEKDGVSDLIAIKSDHYLVNWLYGKAGNSPNGEKSDIIEGLDAIDKIKIIGIDTSEITFAANVITKGVTGIGIYGKGILEALYTGGDLTLAQITQMTSGDASAAAMSNSVNAYGVW